MRTNMWNNGATTRTKRGIGLMTAGLLFLFCISCKQEHEPLRGAELCEQISKIVHTKIDTDSREQKIDSLVRESAALSPVEYYTVLLSALETSVALSRKQQTANYLRRLDSLPFPQLYSKADGFLLVNRYARINSMHIHQEPRMVNPERIATLLFEMENRWQFTPRERLHFLEMKSQIYFSIFREYKSAATIIRDAIRLSQKHTADSATIINLYRALFKYSVWLGQEDKGASLGDEFVQLFEMLQPNSPTEKSIWDMAGKLYERQGNYQKAYDYFKKAKVADSQGFHNIYFRVCVKIDSLSTAQAYIDQYRQNNPQAAEHPYIAWQEACIRLASGDSTGYERRLHELFELCKRFSNKSLRGCTEPMIAYIRMLWEQGQQREAIRQLEWLTDEQKKVISRFANPKNEAFDLNFDDLLVKPTQPFRLLRDYYYKAGYTNEGARMALLCDSIAQLTSEAHLQMRQRKWQAEMYTQDLQRNLDLRAAAFRKERLKFYFSCCMLGIALLAGIVFFLLYRQREHQLNILYAKQKEIELLQTEKQRMASMRSENLSPEEQLFRKLEQQLHKEELFRNPGFSRDDLCRLEGSNRMYISTCINKYAGMNINQWINKARIDYAIRLIGEGESDLNMLSEKSGFASLKSFFRNFKQVTNLSPRQYIVREREYIEQNLIKGQHSEE